MQLVTMSTKGQIVIPKEVRDRAGLAPGDRVEVRIEGTTIILRRSDPRPGSDADDWRRWRGLLRGSGATTDLEREHREEISRDAGLP